MADEVAKAQAAKPGGDTIFGKIIRREIPSDIVYEDDEVRLMIRLAPCSLSYGFYIAFKLGDNEWICALVDAGCASLFATFWLVQW